MLNPTRVRNSVSPVFQVRNQYVFADFGYYITLYIFYWSLTRFTPQMQYLTPKTQPKEKPKTIFLTDSMRQFEIRIQNKFVITSFCVDHPIITNQFFSYLQLRSSKN